MFQITKWLAAYRADEITKLKAENAALKETIRRSRELAETLPVSDGIGETGPYLAGVRYACLRITQILESQQ